MTEMLKLSDKVLSSPDKNVSQRDYKLSRNMEILKLINIRLEYKTQWMCVSQWTENKGQERV